MTRFCSEADDVWMEQGWGRRNKESDSRQISASALHGSGAYGDTLVDRAEKTQFKELYTYTSVHCCDNA